MSLAKKIYRKGYLAYGDLVLRRSYCVLPGDMVNRKNLFIYFDYEREFGGHDTAITDHDVKEILTFLNGAGLKTTWFTVGRIFETYPGSIQRILKEGHEIGSHTYRHIAPYRTQPKALTEDFSLFERASKQFANVNGFHSPNGLWSFAMFKGMKKYDYAYDVIRNPGGVLEKPYRVSYGGLKNAIRLQTLGDDWQLYLQKPGVDKVYSYLMAMLEKMKTGDLAGIGFHPWILYADPNLLEGFKKFVEELSTQKEYNIQTAGQFVERIKKIN